MYGCENWTRKKAVVAQSLSQSNVLWPHGLQHIRLPCPSLSSGGCSNSCPLSKRGHPTISSSVILFSCLQSFPASGSFTMGQFFASSSQSTRASASASVLPTNIQDWFPLGWTGWISLQSKRLSRAFSNNTVQKHLFFFKVQLSHPYTTTGKTIALTTWTFVGKVMSLLLNMLSKFVVCCLNMLSSFCSKEKVSFNFMAAVTVRNDFGAQENKACHCFNCCPIYLPLSDGTRFDDPSFLNVEF